jgi:hypothetical protein
MIARMTIGKPLRIYTIEPLFSPIPVELTTRDGRETAVPELEPGEAESPIIRVMPPPVLLGRRGV